MPSPTVPAERSYSYAGLLTLASRLLAREVDTALYRRLLDSDAYRADGQLLLLEPRHVEAGETAALEDLTAEYCRLFIGPEPACPAYASTHRGEVKLGGRSAAAMDDFMRRYGPGVAVGEWDAVLDSDHLSVELALLAHLYRVAADGEPGTELTDPSPWAAADELLNEHIHPWADSYLRELETVARLAPYNVIACLVQGVLAEAADWTAVGLG
ncbi:MAG: TorD/DmsD family molecular chaperone [Streptomyces sp.]|uniref:TorD/DmsD family molecular chaperone n=1 Tax=Streptomyces sp. TaxID=1931 RepID=UPI003D6A123C